MDFKTTIQINFSDRSKPKHDWTKEALQFMGAQIDSQPILTEDFDPNAMFSDLDELAKLARVADEKNIRNKTCRFNLKNIKTVLVSANDNPTSSTRQAIMQQESTKLTALPASTKIISVVCWHALAGFIHAGQLLPDSCEDQRASSFGTWSFIRELSDVESGDLTMTYDPNTAFETLSEPFTPTFDQFEPTNVFHMVNEFGV